MTRSRSFKTIGIVFLILYATAVFGQTKLPQADEDAIRSSEERYRTAWLANDEKTILSLFREDAALYLGGDTPVRGKAELRKFWFAPSSSVTTLTLFEVKVEDISGRDNFAAAVGSAEIRWTTASKSATKRFVAKEHFVALYTKENGEWKIWKRFGTNKTEEIK